MRGEPQRDIEDSDSSHGTDSLPATDPVLDIGVGPATGPQRRRGTIIISVVVLAVVAGLGLTMLGTGAIERAAASYDASSWLWSTGRGELARINGVTGRVDTRFQVPGGQHHIMQVSQTDKYLILRDLQTGKVTAIDLTTLRVTADIGSAPGLGTVVALDNESAFVIDLVQGVIRQLDPVTLSPIGQPLRFPPGIVGGVFDGHGRLWVGVPSEGTVVAVTPAVLGTAGPSAAPALASTDRTPSISATVAVADPNHDLAVSGLDDGVAVLDNTATTLVTVRGDRRTTAPLNLSGPGALPARTSGDEVPVTVVDDRHIYVVDGDVVRDFTVPGDSPALRPAVAWAGWFYCPDDATGTVYVLDGHGNLAGTITIAKAGGPLELEVRENHLFINAPNSATATVVDDNHTVKKVNKYQNGVLGGDVPPTPKTPPTQDKPKVGPPGQPSNVVASAGNASAHVSWGAAKSNGSKVTSYVIEGDGQQHKVGADQRSIDITGLTNGKQYRFTVYAVNAKGSGPKRAANPIVPTSDVPDPPTAVVATARPDGTVEVAWAAANGQGRKIVSYTVTAITAGVSNQVGSTRTTKLTIPAGTLDYGTQYTFTVIAVNDKGGGSKASAPSDTIVPFTAPDKVTNLAARTVPDQAGTIAVSWQPGADNGRPIQKYQVDAGRGFQDVAGVSVKLTGLGNGSTVTVKVHAVNEAGNGPDASDTARTVSPPAVTQTSAPTTSYTGAKFAFTVNNGGGTTACAVSINNGPAATVPCTGGPIGGLWPGNSYTYAFTATNPAGTDRVSGTIATPTLNGSVVCTVPSYCGPQSPNGEGVWLYYIAHQTSGQGAGDEFAGYRTKALCWTPDTQGSTINAQPYGGKKSSIWIRVVYGGRTAYIPYAWFTLDAGETGGGAPSGILPGC
jgi:hypothetical protein